MIRFTTITHTHKVYGIDLTDCSEVWVSYEQGNTSVDLLSNSVVYDPDDANGPCSKVTVTLSQEETGGFKRGPVKVQINWLYADDTRNAVEIKTYEMADNLIPRVMPDES